MEKYKNSEFVKITKKSIAEMFDMCNELYFNNEVERPKHFEVFTPNAKVLAMVRGGFNARTEQYYSCLHVSKLYNWTEENLRDTVVHEMIHLYLKDYLTPLSFIQRWFGWLPWVDNNPHDDNFIEMMNYLNEEFGLHVVVKGVHMRPFLKIKKK